MLQHIFSGLIQVGDTSGWGKNINMHVLRSHFTKANFL